ncbi:hypothetical protein SAMN05216232_2339 [Virgibacillus subterraneus]|uniref:Uncharacterized protein n=2 Tax=Virgibacillus TaxID=84406 RepID=A0A1H1ECK3_9BACI|nr:MULTISPECIES: hypothetical protein [Virgibacillus]SDQ86541.1 hypothetical protein SAMN05216231_2829 [Virgibacillus salinus]SEQ41669.1 hypothetical protein SAMN05216232_2339 [Virgibacillus subterraneus]
MEAVSHNQVTQEFKNRNFLYSFIAAMFLSIGYFVYVIGVDSLKNKTILSYRKRERGVQNEE